MEHAKGPENESRAPLQYCYRHKSGYCGLRLLKEPSMVLRVVEALDLTRSEPRSERAIGGEDSFEDPAMTATVFLFKGSDHNLHELVNLTVRCG